MNERIIELMMEAGNSTIPGEKRIDADFCNKFAELIIQECADLVDNHDDSYPYVSFGDMIKRHFGLE